MAAVRGRPSGRPRRRCPGFQPAYSCHLFVRKPNGAAPTFQWSSTKKIYAESPRNKYRSNIPVRYPSIAKNSTKRPTAPLITTSIRTLTSGVHSHPRAHVPRHPGVRHRIAAGQCQRNTRLGHRDAQQLRRDARTSHRKTALGIAQIVMLSELAVNQTLDNVQPTA